MADQAAVGRPYLPTLQTMSCPQQHSQTLSSQGNLMDVSTHSQPASPATHPVVLVTATAETSLQSSSTSQGAQGGAKQLPRRRGRPVEYGGDISSPLLTQRERAGIKRRMLNRQAACRLRQRHQDTLKDARSKVTTLRQRNKQLVEEVHDKRAWRRKLQEQLVEAQSDWSAAAADQEQLQAQVHSLRHSLEVGLQLLEEANQAAKRPARVEQTPYRLVPTQDITPPEVHMGSPALSSTSHEVQQPLHLSSFAPSLTARESLPSQWMCPPVGHLSGGTPDRAGHLSSGLRLRAGQVPEEPLSSPGPFSSQGPFSNQGPFCDLWPLSSPESAPKQGQGSVLALPSGSSMGSTSCRRESTKTSATLRDYLLSSSCSRGAVSCVHQSALNPDPVAAAYASSSPVRQ